MSFAQLKSFLNRAFVPGTAFLGAGLSASGAFYSLPWLVVFGALIAALSALAAAIWQSEWSDKIERQGVVIAEKAVRIESLVTGGDSVAYFGFSATQSPNSFQLIALNSGSFPLYEVSARIVDLTAARGAPTIVQGLQQNEITIALGNIPATAAMLTVHQMHFPASALVQDYNIFFSGRNGFWTQLNRFRKSSNGKWIEACRVMGINGKVVHEKIDPGFPLNTTGSVDWN